MKATLNDFYVLRTLGVGASCKVKLGEHMKTNKQVAIKIMNSNTDDETLKVLH